MSPLEAVYAVADQLGVSALAILSSERSKPLPVARMLVSWLLTPEYSTYDIAAALGKAESSVRYYLSELNRVCLWDAEIRRARKELLATMFSFGEPPA